MTPFLFQNGVHGIYAVEAISDIPGSASYGDWTNITTTPSGGAGAAFVSDGPGDPATAAMAAWTETVAVKPNSTYVFSFYGAEVSNDCCANAVLLPSINGAPGTPQAQVGAWQQMSMTWNSGANTSATLVIQDLTDAGPFNDFALDDIALTGPAVPEPATWAMLLLGVAMIGAAARRRNAGLA
jgi:hypothetical protein